MKLIHTIGLVSGVVAISAASFLAACSSDSSSSTPATDGGTTPDGNTGNPDSASGPDTGFSNPDAGSPDSGGALTCAAYCSTIATNCTGANQQYIDNTTCLSMCAKFMTGTAADTSGDTLGCRTYHAGAAATNATFHCPHAGPTGNSVCSTSTCAAFCELDLAQCSGAMAAYPDQNTCVTDCNAYATVDGGEIATLSGNSLNCRVYHLEAAYGDPTTHCPHTGPSVDAGPCH